MMITRFHICVAASALAALLLNSGCSKKESSATAPPSQETQAQTNSVAAQPAQSDIPELNRALIRWVMGHRRTPANFDEFAATAGVTIPPPPPGKKYVINKKDMHITLVDR